MVITISRQYGSGGHLVGQQLAQRLGLRFLDREIIEAVAQQLKVPADWIEDKDEAVEGLRERIRNFMALSLPDSPVYPPPPGAGVEPLTAELTQRYTREMIRQAAEVGNVVIVGRAAQVLLASHPGALHVFLYAPREMRATRVIEQRGLSHDAALRLIEEMDRKRAEYLRVYYGRDWRQPELYHLMLDTGMTGIEGAVELILWWRERFAARQPA
mgnify:CR=1 FL=1